MSDWEAKQASKRERVERIKGILLENGITMAVDACSCCDAAHLFFEYNGEVIVDMDSEDEGFWNFDMRPKKEKSSD